MKTPPMVSPEEWRTARQKLVMKEKALTRARDAMAAERRRMPWMAVDKAYWFEGPTGRVSLAELFEGRRQLIVYRAFYGPEVTTYAEGGSYPERACVGCSFVADQVAHPAHLNARNTTLAFASRAPQADIQRLKERCGWEHIPWYTIKDNFDKDFDVNEWHGTPAARGIDVDAVGQIVADGVEEPLSVGLARDWRVRCGPPGYFRHRARYRPSGRLSMLAIWPPHSA